jgi:hypothetical protein
MPFRWSSRWLSCGVCALFGLLSACKAFESTCDEDDRTCLGGGLARRGEACIRTGDCATGMACRDGECEYAATTKVGGKCVASAECVAGAYCGSDARCTKLSSKPGSEGAACSDGSQCAKDLACDLDLARAFEAGPFSTLSDACRASIVRLEASPECTLPTICMSRGSRDFGEACKQNADCMPGLYCAWRPLRDTDETTCLGGTQLPDELLTIPTWDGVKCGPDSETPTAYFDLEAGTSDAHDFYRLPFPNDVRRSSDGIDLSGHPMPPASIEPPVAARFIEDVATLSGFSTNPIVYFRFSTAYDNTALSLSSVRIVDITPSSPDYNQNATIVWGPAERESRYICPHWLSLHRPIGAPLRANTTYAAVVTRKLKTAEAQDFERSPDFEAMLRDDAPEDGAALRAWQAYAPLRNWLADEAAPFEADDLLNAAVFTTGAPAGVVPQLKAAVEAEGGPGLKSLTVCKAGVKSPCEDASGRGACHDAQPGFTEIHGKLTLPIFQSGTAPYEKPEDGGGIEIANGGPHATRNEDVCFALSLPARAAPAAGYPLVIYAHPIGGVFQEAMGERGLASELAQASTPAAVLAIDLPEHGARRGSSSLSPQDLIANLQNPAAVRGNALQGAADLWSAIALAKIGILAGPVDGQPIRFDSNRIALFAQGQGAVHASIALTADDTIAAAVLAAVPGHFSTVQLQRTKPASMAALLPLLLVDYDEDRSLAGGAVNPMLALMQNAVDAADPVNYADRSFRIGDDRGRDLFVVFGRNDHFSPDAAQEAFAKAAKLQAVKPDLTMRFEDLDAPVQHNQSIGTDRRTVALRQYDPSTAPSVEGAPEDGHFVVQATKGAHTDVVRFLTDALSGKPPTIGAETR